jgi:hypothetical protein
VLDDFGERSFSFYPPILNVEHNEWRFRQGTWSEILVHNQKAGIEVWIPRSYLGELSKVEDPVMIVGLRRELEYKGGAVWPYVRRVIAMPAGPSARPPSGGHEPHAPAGQGLRLDSSESKIGRLIGAVLVIGIVACFLVVMLFRRQTTGGEIEYQGVVQADLGLSYHSNYFDVVRKLGRPDQDRWQSETGERQYRALVYARKDLIAILMGPDRNDMHYIGAKDGRWRTVHFVEIPGGRHTDAILRALKRF